MVEALKKLDKKFLIFAGCIIFLPIIIIIFLAVIRGCSGGTISYEKYEDKMVSATQRYLEKEKKKPISEGEVETVKLSTLVEKEYIKATEKLLDDASCKGEVKARRNGSSIESNGEGFLNYTVTLTCEDYKTTHLVDKITKNIVTSGSGLYLINDEYVFKGDKVKNFVNLFGINYRIMSVDKNGILKLVKSEPENANRLWDNKYNTEANYSYGKNIYKDSAILNYLMLDYENSKKVSKKAKQKVMAYDVCIGKRSGQDFSINKSLDCSENLEKQIVSLMNVSDFAMASTDPDCNSIKSMACKNYNYLSSIASSTWTLNALSDNTYEAFFISDGIAQHQTTNSYNEYNMVIYIDGNELYTTGEGTQLNPYMINE